MLKNKKKVRLWFTIKNKLLTAFMSQLVIITILGIFTYRQSAKIIIGNYEKSTLATLDIMSEHFSYMFRSLESIVLELSIRQDVREYVSGFMDEPFDLRSFKRKYSSDLAIEVFYNDAIRSIQVMGENNEGFYVDGDGQSTGNLDGAFYQEYLASDEMRRFLESGETSAWYGMHPVLDERTEQTQLGYSMYFIRKIVDFRSDVGYVVLDVSKAFITEKLKTGDLPKGSIVSFITADGCETIFTEGQEHLSIKNSEFYEMIENDPKSNHGYDYGEYDDEKYMFIYSRVDNNNSYICAMLPESIVTDQVRLLNIATILGIIVAGMIAMIVGLSISNAFGNTISMTNNVLAKVAKGELNVQMSKKRNDEFGTISENINQILDTIQKATEQEKEAVLRSKEAEIRSLEAQINPHFLYNTLDAINWVAIDQGALEASNMIVNLADILRYSIKNSNEVVTLSMEMEYLKKYIQLQQRRFRYSFDCILDVDDNVMNAPVHKLLIQPLIENAIAHAFVGRNDNNEIIIHIKKDEDKLIIQVNDNGIGMDPSLIEEINHFDFEQDKIEKNIGIRNVATRLKMYYGDEGSIYIDSDETGTRIKIVIPYKGDDVV